MICIESIALSTKSLLGIARIILVSDLVLDLTPESASLVLSLALDLVPVLRSVLENAGLAPIPVLDLTRDLTREIALLLTTPLNAGLDLNRETALALLNALRNAGLALDLTQETALVPGAVSVVRSMISSLET
jgi:hypothetical protein